MLEKEKLDYMIESYKVFMIEPLVTSRLDNDMYDKIEVIFNYDVMSYEVVFGAIRKRPDKYVIEKMYCILTRVRVFDIEHWYEQYSKIIEDSHKWKWEYRS